MAPSEIYPAWDQRRPRDYRPYPEEANHTWVTISEVARPGIVQHGFNQYPGDKMDHEFGSPRFDAPVRMFDGPIGPSPEEDKNAPFYVPPRSRTPPQAPYQYDFQEFPRSSLPQYLPPYGDDRDDHRDRWRSEAPINESHHSYTDREYPKGERNPYSAQRHSPGDLKASNFPYPKQARHRDHSKERHAPPSASKSRRHNSNVPSARHRRRTSSITRRQSSRETSVSNTSQHHRQLSHDEPAHPRPLSRPDLSPPSSYSNERALSSPQSLPISPISTPSVAGRSWNGTPPHIKMVEDTTIPQAITILNQMLQRQSLEQILHHWKCTGQGPNPYEYPQWEGWSRDPPRRTFSPRSIRGDAPWTAPGNP